LWADSSGLPSLTGDSRLTQAIAETADIHFAGVQSCLSFKHSFAKGEPVGLRGRGFKVDLFQVIAAPGFFSR
jgi:hypothetical protein